MAEGVGLALQTGNVSPLALELAQVLAEDEVEHRGFCV